MLVMDKYTASNRCLRLGLLHLYVLNVSCVKTTHKINWILPQI